MCSGTAGVLRLPPVEPAPPAPAGAPRGAALGAQHAGMDVLGESGAAGSSLATTTGCCASLSSFCPLSELQNLSQKGGVITDTLL